MLTRLPSGPSGSTIAGILLLGLIARKSGAICSPLVMLTGNTSYVSPISSSATLIFRTFGVFPVGSSLVIFCFPPAKAGDPVPGTLEAYNRRRGILDHPLSRMMTPALLTARHRL